MTAATEAMSTADKCEQIFYAVLSAGDARGMEAALKVMAVQDPNRAQALLNDLRLALAIAQGGKEPKHG